MKNLLACMVIVSLFSAAFTLETNAQQSNENAFLLSKEEVFRVQNALNDFGFNVGKADGILGRQTHRGLKKFQADRRLNATGSPDADTIAKLLEDHSNAPKNYDGIWVINIIRDPVSANHSAQSNKYVTRTPVATARLKFKGGRFETIKSSVVTKSDSSDFNDFEVNLSKTGLVSVSGTFGYRYIKRNRRFIRASKQLPKVVPLVRNIEFKGNMFDPTYRAVVQMYRLTEQFEVPNLTRRKK